MSASKRVGGVADLALAGEEDEDVAGALGRQLAHGVDDRLGLVALDRLAVLVVLGQLEQGAVADLDRERTTRHLDDGRAEVGGEPVDVDRRAGDDHLEVGPAREQALEVAEEEVDVEAALVGLVDDERVVLAEVAVALELGEQDAVGHQLDPAGLRGAVGEPHLVADHVAELGAELLGDPLRHRAGGDPARLGVPDQLPALGGAGAATELEADLRQLGGLPRPGLAGDDDDLVVADRRGDVVAARGDRQVRRVGDLHNGRHSRPLQQPGLQRSAGQPMVPPRLAEDGHVVLASPARPVVHQHYAALPSGRARGRRRKPSTPASLQPHAVAPDECRCSKAAGSATGW